jgi:hypothetical protein
MIHGCAVQSGSALTLRARWERARRSKSGGPRVRARGSSASDDQVRLEHCTCTVLLVENDPLVMTETAALLEDQSHTVEASSAEVTRLGSPRSAKPFRPDELENAITSIVTPACEPVDVVPFPNLDDVPTGMPMLLCCLQALAPTFLGTVSTVFAPIVLRSAPGTPPDVSRTSALDRISRPY